VKITPFSNISGISIDRIYRFIKTTDWQGKKTGPGNGIDLTPEQQSVIIAALPADRPPKEPPYEPRRKEWLQTWVTSYESATEGRTKGAILAVIGGLLCAKDRAWLDGACEGARNGDLLVELAYSSLVDYGEAGARGQDPGSNEFYGGFTRYLLDNGFESPGWDIL
jgi:hypothetical protein